MIIDLINHAACFVYRSFGHGGCVGVQVLAATNRPQAVDAALLRPGRLDTLLFVPPPDVQGRLQALSIHTRSIPLHADVSLEVGSIFLLDS